MSWSSPSIWASCKCVTLPHFAFSFLCTFWWWNNRYNLWIKQKKALCHCHVHYTVVQRGDWEEKKICFLLNVSQQCTDVYYFWNLFKWGGQCRAKEEESSLTGVIPAGKTFDSSGRWLNPGLSLGPVSPIPHIYQALTPTNCEKSFLSSWET